ELADRRPGELAGCNQLAKLPRFHLGLLDVIGGLDGGAQDRLRINLATIVGIGAGHVDVPPSASHSARHTGAAELVMVTTTSASATQACAEDAGITSTPSSFSTERA